LLVHLPTGDILAKTNFEVTDLWKNLNAGPPGFHLLAPLPAGEDGWGDGTSDVTPQNMRVKPHTGSWTVMILLVDTTDRRWPAPIDGDTTIADFRRAILDNMTNGILMPDGRNCSVQRYYEENSSFSGGNTSGLTVNVYQNQTFGVLELKNSFASYHYQPWASVGDSRWVMQWNALETVIKEARDAGIASTADFRACDAVAVFPFPVDPIGSPTYTWPAAWWKFPKLIGDTATDTHDIAQFWMTSDWLVRDGRQVFATMSHELGHTMDLLDLYSKPSDYSPEINGRTVGTWDMMASDSSDMPQYSMSNKMRIGWVADTQIRTFNFSDFDRNEKTVTLHPARQATSPAGQFRAVELRLADGWNYIIELRVPPSGAEISDSQVSSPVVMISDTTTDAFVTSITRPNILFVTEDSDHDGWLISAGQDLRETDPGNARQLVVKVDSISAAQAVLSITYNSNGRPDPSIRPWDGARSNWQSPDIEVRNSKSTENPALYFNTPWLGQENRVVAKITNRGDRPATGVEAEFFVTEFTTGEGPWQSLGTDTRSVDVDATVEFECTWFPPAPSSPTDSKHYCIIVRINLYQDPSDPTIIETNIFNNEARSNYTSFVSASASPSERVVTELSLSNPFNENGLVHADVRGGHWAHRLFTEHSWLRVPGQSEKKIKVWGECIIGTREWEERFLGKEEGVWKEPCQLSLQGIVERPVEKLRCLQREVTGGAGMKIFAARKTTIKITDLNHASVSGQVTFANKKDGNVDRGGKLLFEMTDRDGKVVIKPDRLNADGHFGFKFAEVEAVACIVHYLGTFSAAPVESEPLQVPSGRLTANL
jgi:M6 family metalloprotease-like protein